MLTDLELATMTVDDMVEAFRCWERGEEWSPARGEVAPRNHADRVDALVTALNRCTTTGVHEWSECEKNPEKAQNRTPAVLQGPRLARSGRPDSRLTVKRRLALSKAWKRLEPVERARFDALRGHLGLSKRRDLAWLLTVMRTTAMSNAQIKAAWRKSRHLRR